MSKNIHPNLPWYVNHTLSDMERQRIEAAASQPDSPIHAELAAWQQVQAALQARPQQPVSPQIRQQLFTQIHNSQLPVTHQKGWAWRTVSYATLAIAIFILLWLVVQPGIVLEWASESTEISTFRVYRAETGSSAYELIAEIPGQPEKMAYNFVDAWLLPGQQVTYVIEGINASGQAALSQAVSDNSLAALPGQIALLVSSSVLAGLLVMAIKRTTKGHPLQSLQRSFV